MDTLLIIRCDRGLYRVSYNGVISDPVPYFELDKATWRVMSIYHARWGVGR